MNITKNILLSSIAGATLLTNLMLSNAQAAGRPGGPSHSMGGTKFSSMSIKSSQIQMQPRVFAAKNTGIVPQLSKSPTVNKIHATNVNKFNGPVLKHQVQKLHSLPLNKFPVKTPIVNHPIKPFPVKHDPQHHHHYPYWWGSYGWGASCWSQPCYGGWVVCPPVIAAPYGVPAAPIGDAGLPDAPPVEGDPIAEGELPADLGAGGTPDGAALPAEGELPATEGEEPIAELPAEGTDLPAIEDAPTGPGALLQATKLANAISGKLAATKSNASGNLVGTFNAKPAADVAISLTLNADKSFTWKFSQKGQAKNMNGTFERSGNSLTLKSNKAGEQPLAGTVTMTANGFKFQLKNAKAGDPGLTFNR